MNSGMEIQKYLRLLGRYWRSVVAVGLLSLITAAGFTLLQAPVYTATSSLFLSVESGDSAGDLAQGANYAERQVKSFVTVATSAIVLQPAIDELKLGMTTEQLARTISVSTPTGTSIVRVAARDAEPDHAARLANAVAANLAKAVHSLAPSALDGNRLVSATVIDEALPPVNRTSPRPAVNLAAGLVLGLVLGVGQAVVRSQLDTKLRSVGDVEELSDAPLLGVIGHRDTSSGARQVASREQWATSEAYRRLRTNVGFVGLGGERRPSLVMTSSVSSEGKTETAVNLARVLSEAGESVLLVDADLRRPHVAPRMGLDSQLGLSDVLTGRGDLRDLLIPVSSSLSVLPAGTIPPNPSELLGSEAMAHLLIAVEREFDHVIFDAPPLLPVTDAVVLAAQTSGAIVVARSGKVTKPEFEAAGDVLQAGSVALLGVVLNDVPQNLNSTYGGYYAREDKDDKPMLKAGA